MTQSHITAAASDVENVLPVLTCAAASNRAVSRPSIRSCRSRCSTNSHPLAPFQSSALLHIHRHEGHAMPGPVPDTPFGTFLLEIATARESMPEQGVLRAAARLSDTATDHPESAIGSPDTAPQLPTVIGACG